MNVAVIINNKAGSINGVGKAAAFNHVREVFKKHGLQAGVQFVPSERVVTTAREALASGVDAIVAGGGDGTISSVAETIVDTPTLLGVLPLGTHNHFAKDLGIPPDFEAAVQCIAVGLVRAIDVGEVNGRIFINNSSVGAYPRVVEERDRLRQRLGSKWLAMMVSMIRVFWRFPLIHVRIDLDGKTIHRSTPFVFIGNNEYTVNLFNVSMRSCLNGGKLCVYTARCDGPGCLYKLFFLAMLNRLEQADNFESMSASEVRIYPHKSRMRVAKDGEVIRMQTPLHYRVRSGALRVIAPATPA